MKVVGLCVLRDSPKKADNRIRRALRVVFLFLMLRLFSLAALPPLLRERVRHVLRPYPFIELLGSQQAQFQSRFS